MEGETIDEDYDLGVEAQVSQLNTLASLMQAGARAISDAARWQKEAEYWRGEYNKLLSESVQHSEQMTGLMLKAALDGAFTPKQPV